MNKKGFTLIELLSVIVLLSLLMGIAIPGISKISNNVKNKSLNTKIDLIESAAVLWGQDNKTLLRKKICTIDEKIYECTTLTVKELLENDYLDDDMINPVTKKSMLDDCISVYKMNNRVYSKYSETACLSESNKITELSNISTGEKYKIVYNTSDDFIIPSSKDVLEKIVKNNYSENKSSFLNLTRCGKYLTFKENINIKEAKCDVITEDDAIYSKNKNLEYEIYNSSNEKIKNPDDLKIIIDVSNYSDNKVNFAYKIESDKYKVIPETGTINKTINIKDNDGPILYYEDSGNIIEYNEADEQNKNIYINISKSKNNIAYHKDTKIKYNIFDTTDGYSDYVLSDIKKILPPNVFPLNFKFFQQTLILKDSYGNEKSYDLKLYLKENRAPYIEFYGGDKYYKDELLEDGEPSMKILLKSLNYNDDDGDIIEANFILENKNNNKIYYSNNLVEIIDSGEYVFKVLVADNNSEIASFDTNIEIMDSNCGLSCLEDRYDSFYHQYYTNGDSDDANSANDIHDQIKDDYGIDYGDHIGD